MPDAARRRCSSYGACFFAVRPKEHITLKTRATETCTSSPLAIFLSCWLAVPVACT